MRGYPVLLVLVVLTGCASRRADAVPSCPHCRDPITRTLPDGRSYVMTRLRMEGVPEDPLMPLFFTAAREVDPSHTGNR